MAYDLDKKDELMLLIEIIPRNWYSTLGKNIVAVAFTRPSDPNNRSKDTKQDLLRHDLAYGIDYKETLAAM
ncbi:hypothetical protein NL676_012839 [Syzygium grande]|nr:hypothetical protein NL676_012839 [Syzygium grande]